MSISVSSRSVRYTSGIQKRSGTGALYNKTKAGGIVIDTADSYKLKYNQGGTVVTIGDAQTLGNSQNALSAGLNVGVAESTVTAVEYGFGGFIHKTVLTLAATPVAVADATAGGGVKIYTFPLGAQTILGGSFSLTPTTTSTIASTLKSGVTIEVGVGTATAGAGALTTTEEDIVIGATGPSSTVINTAAAAIVSVRSQAPAIFDGHTTALPIYLNVGVPTGTDIDADATMTWAGTITLLWAHADDV